MKTKLFMFISLLLFISNIYGQEYSLKYFNEKYDNNDMIILSLKSQKKLPKHFKQQEYHFINEDKISQILKNARNACFASTFNKREIKGILGVFKIDKRGEIFDVTYHLRAKNIQNIPEEELFAFYNRLKEINWLEYIQTSNGNKEFDYLIFMYPILR